MRNRRRPSPPETPAQAAEWERAKTRYLDLDLCHKCAAQAAFAHQTGAGGWLPIEPPCQLCAVIVAELPLETPNPVWRKSPRHPSRLGGAPPRRVGSSAASNGPLGDAGVGARTALNGEVTE